MPETKYSEIKQIIGRPPSWLVKSGSFLIFFTVLGIVALSYFIKYPEMVTTKVTLTSNNKPIALITNTEGWINPSSKGIGQMVSQGEILAEISDDIDYSIIKELKNYVEEIEKFINSNLNNFNLKEFDELGDLQIQYNELNRAIKEIILYSNNNDENIIINNLRSEIERKNNYLNLIESVLSLYEQKYNLARISFKRDSALRQVNVKSDFDLEQSMSLLLSNKLDYENEKLKIHLTKTEINSLQKNIKLLEGQQNTKITQLKISISTALNNIKSRIFSWENKHLIISPISGTISYYKDWVEDEFVTKGEEFATIIPVENEIYGVCYVNQEGYGRLMVGQNASIKLNDYPHYEFGKIDAKVSFVSNLNRDQGYYVKLTIGDKLLTKNNKEISFNREMVGTAEIITKDLKLLERFIYHIKSILDN